VETAPAGDCPLDLVLTVVPPLSVSSDSRTST
jgi:hypothetical protein